jgi:hypothetical protein
MSASIPIFSNNPKAVSTPKLRALVKFPGNVIATNGIGVEKRNGTWTFETDWSEFATSVTPSPNSYVLTFDPQTGIYILVPSHLLSGAGVEQHITAAGPTSINNNTAIVRVDQAVGAPITLNMGLASAKTCPVTIVDWKGDAGTNNITITLSAPDKFPGGLSSWKIAGNNGSVLLTPLAGIGYVL